MRHVVTVLLLGGLLAVGASSVRGQDDLQYGLTLGFNRATLENTPVDVSGRTVFTGGFGVRKQVYGPLSLQAELLVSQQGTEIDREGGGAIEYGAGYLELPLSVRAQAPPVGAFTFYGEGGGFGAVKLFERQTAGEGDINTSFDTDTSFYRQTSGGALAAVGAIVEIQGQQINVAVRRSWGLVDVAQDIEDQPFPGTPFPSTGKTRTWSMLLRLGF